MLYSLRLRNPSSADAWVYKLSLTISRTLSSTTSMSPQVKYTSLPELLLARSRTSTAELGYLDAEGNVAKTQTYSQLFADAQVVAQRLVSAGLKTDGTDIVVTSFADHESHILIFWACCFGKYPVVSFPNTK